MTITNDLEVQEKILVDAINRSKAISKAIRLKTPHEHQRAFIESPAKRKVVRAGRRGGKTVGTAILAVEAFLRGKRILYGAPTVEQIDAFWREVKSSLAGLLQTPSYRKNEVEHTIEASDNAENRIKAKTIWNADTARGDYADLLILDEWQLCDESAWSEVGAPMLLDNDGDAVCGYTPPALKRGGLSKARDPLHAAKMYRSAAEDASGRWEVFHFSSKDNPHISIDALGDLMADMSREAYRREIEAEDDDVSPNRLIYGAFDERQCVIHPFDIPKAWPRYVGHDFGSANPAALFFAQDPATGYFFCYREYFPGRGLSTYQHVQAFKEMTEGVTVLKRAGGSHQEDEIRQGYTAQGWPIQEPKILNVNARIDRVRGIIEKNQLFVFNTLPRLREELMTYLWKADAEGRMTDEIYNKSAFHLCDCMAYILSDFMPESVRSRAFGNVRIPIAQF